ncbi:hypothetical protein ACFWGP_01380 [Agromyces sp. NPDC127015]|uniref:hypothetical protein n=1 Tax=Agromyces sp. NPDC127015 TaxID=3347108 RepID=UPI00364690D2
MDRLTVRRALRSAATAAALAFMLTGCIPAAGDARPVTSAPPTDSAAAFGDAEHEPDAEAAPQSIAGLAPGTVLATGEFHDRGTSGAIELRANGTPSGFEVVLTGISPAPTAGMTLELNSEPSTATREVLKEGFSYYRYDPLATTADQAFRVPTPGTGGFVTNDPSYLRTAVLWAPAAGAERGFDEVVATAPLTWNLPDLNPGLRVVDHGAAEGATGEAVLDDDGTPLRYRIAAGDTSIGVTARFGVTVDDLRWLNPDRAGSKLLLADRWLNLSREDRGLRG